MNQFELAASIEDDVENLIITVNKWRTDNSTTIDYRVEGLLANLRRVDGSIANLLSEAQVDRERAVKFAAQLEADTGISVDGIPLDDNDSPEARAARDADLGGYRG